MDVFENAAQSSSKSPFRAILGTLLRDVGTERFDDTLNSTVGNILICKHITAFAFGKQSPRVVTVAAGAQNDVARIAAQRYVACHWQNDPSNVFWRRDFNDDRSCIVLMSLDEVGDKDYQRDCYINTNIWYRASILRKFDGEYLKISFHRPREYGPFLPGSLFDLSEQVDILGLVLLRHSDSAKAPAPHSAEDFEGKLAIRRPQLTSRERKVCSLISAGMSSEAIALILGVSINTVLTFRRRAYARLQISSQNELMRIVYS